MRYQPPDKPRHDRVLPRDDESEEHWKHRMRVRNYYKFRNPAGERVWLTHWGNRPPDNQALYIEPPDEDYRTNGASGKAPS